MYFKNNIEHNLTSISFVARTRTTYEKCWSERAKAKFRLEKCINCVWFQYCNYFIIHKSRLAYFINFITQSGRLVWANKKVALEMRAAKTNILTSLDTFFENVLNNNFYTILIKLKFFEHNTSQVIIMTVWKITSSYIYVTLIIALLITWWYYE